jgi:sterol-4alpha-carboxylate 3-dehydrogenase (decarboxylating)
MATPTSTSGSLGKVLVIGGCGFLGSHIVSLIHTQYPQTSISIIDLVTERNRLDSPLITYHACDITSTTGLLPIFEGVRPNAVIHTASPTLMGGSKALYEKVNVGGTKALLEVALKTGVQAFVYTSSASVISDNVGDLINVDERWPIVPRELQTEIYSTTKVCLSFLFGGVNWVNDP